MLITLPAFARRMQTVGESGTTRIFTLARKLSHQGRHIISLAVGEPDFDTPAAGGGTPPGRPWRTGRTPLRGRIRH